MGPAARALRALAGLALLLGPAASGASQAAGSGVLLSADELAAVRRGADRGVAALAAFRESLAAEARRPWRWGRVAGTFTTTRRGAEKVCHPVGEPERFDVLEEGAPDAYAMALAHRLGVAPAAGGRDLASEARARVLDWVDTGGFHGLAGLDWSAANQCILELAISVPVWIETARVLDGTAAWTPDDGRALARWLADEVYPRVAWASRVRRNNWGAAGSLSASAIARYVQGRVGELVELEPERRALAPAEAAAAHDAIQARRIGTRWPGDSECERHGIQDHGGIPDELRRGAGGCLATSLPSARDAAHAYQTMHVELLVHHAELLRRAGDDSLYAMRTAAGAPAILRAILFVIDNPAPEGRSWRWGTRTGALAVAWRAYGDPRLLDALRDPPSFRGGRVLPYATVVPRVADGAPAVRP